MRSLSYIVMRPNRADLSGTILTQKIAIEAKAYGMSHRWISWAGC